MDINQGFGLRFNFDDTNTGGQTLPEGTTVSYYAEFVDGTGTSTWYPPLSQDGVPDTPGVQFEMRVPSGAAAGLSPGDYTAYVHAVADYPGGVGPMRSERSNGVPLALWEALPPAAPSGLELVP